MESSITTEQPSLARNWGRIILLALAGSMIYGLPYFRSYYYDAYLETYHLNNTQMGTLGAAFGVLGVLSYLAGGVLADRFSAKTLLVFSLIATGAGGFLHILFPFYQALVAIYALWGITSLLTFWPALMKIVRLQADATEQSRAYGLFEGARGVVSAAHLAIATAIFGVFAAAAPRMGLTWIIVFYSVVPIVIGVIFIFLLKDTSSAVKADAAAHGDNVAAADKFRWADVGHVLKMPAVWLVVALLFCTYMFNMSFYYFTPYATSEAIGMVAVTAAILTVLAQYIRPAASPLGGFLADKFGRAMTMAIGFATLAAGTIIVIAASSVAPEQRMIVLFVGAVIVYVAMYSNFGIYFSLLSEGGVPAKDSGIAIGIVCTVGYLPEIVAPMVAGNLLDAYPGVTGFHYLFYILIGCAVAGIVLCVIWMLTVGRKAAQLKKEEAHS